MSDLDHENNQLFVAYLTKNTVVAHAISPKMTKFASGQTMTDKARIIERGHLAAQVFAYALRLGTTKFLKLPDRIIG